MKKLGFIVNPVAGIGGRVGLKGSDGKDIQKRAFKLGAIPLAPQRAKEALKPLLAIKDKIIILTYPRAMGEEEARELGFKLEVIGDTEDNTTSKDTKNAATGMRELGVDLILFVGGDGTARDVFEAIDGEVPVLGVPAGVKIHSGVYAISPRDAGALAVKYLLGEGVDVKEAEVMDIDEEAFRDNRLSAKLYGYMNTLYSTDRMQGSKEGSGYTERYSQEAIAIDITTELEEETAYVIGPGSTTKFITDELGLKKTLLGVDVMINKEIVAADANEQTILGAIEGRDAKIVVTVIGGQGFIFGRGNQQISPQIIRQVGKENIIIIATPSKLAGLQSIALRADTGDLELDEALKGYHKVITGYGRRTVVKVV